MSTFALYSLMLIPSIAAILIALVSARIAHARHLKAQHALEEMQLRQAQLMRLRALLSTTTALIADERGPTGTRLAAPARARIRHIG